MPSDDERRTCNDCGEEIDGWDLTVKVYRADSDAQATYYHSRCYSERDAVARRIEQGDFDGV